jgi:hypothetical protein
MLRALGPRAQSARLLASHCVTCMSSPSPKESIDDTIDTSLTLNTSLNSRGGQSHHCGSSWYRWTIDADSSERSEVRVGGVLCDEVRTNQARSPVHPRRFGKSCLVTLLGENFDQVSKY